MKRILPLFSMVVVLALFNIASAKSPKRLLAQSKELYYDSVMVDYLSNPNSEDNEDKSKIIEPKFKGGSGAIEFTRWCAANVFFPSEILKYGPLDVKVVIAFLINYEGKMYSPTVIEYEFVKGPDNQRIRDALAKNLIALVRRAPKAWKPMMYDNKPKNVVVRLPMIYRSE